MLRILSVVFGILLIFGCADVSQESQLQTGCSGGSESTPENVYVSPAPTPTPSDTTAPTIAASSPSNGATNVSASSDITITFSESMDSSTINTSNITLTDSSGNRVNGVVSYSSNIVTFNPSGNLGFSTTYTITAKTGNKDSTGNPLASNFTASFSTSSAPDTTAPTISSNFPSSGATNVSASSEITITFNESMESSTINTSNITLADNSGNNVSGVVSYNNNVATFNPSSNLNYSSSYTVTVGTGVKDSAGNALASSSSWSFTTSSAPDTTAPTIPSTSPSSGANIVSISTNITVTFSEEMDSSTINTSNITVQDSNGNAISGVVSYSSQVATFNPSSDLSYFTVYTVTVGTGVKDSAGNALASSSSWSFTTSSAPDTTAPTISSTSPSNGANSISISSNITITFSEAMNASTINTSNITVTDSGGNSVGGVVSYSSNVATFNPSSNLNQNTTYTVTVGNGVKDSAGNSLNLQYSWNFLTFYPTIISAGFYHSCTVLSNNTIKCWGRNNYGQLGDGSTTYNKYIPVAVSGISTATSVTIGETHTCALLTDKTIKCWGNNENGQLGDGTTTNRTTPVTVSGISDATAISAGEKHTCAILSDTSIKCWGSNIAGQLGDGTTTNRITPVTVSGNSFFHNTNNAVAISAGSFHTCALISDSTIKCWGANGFGQLGDTSNLTRLTPVWVRNESYQIFSNFTAVTATDSHTCALLNDNTVKCWGWDGNERLGLGYNFYGKKFSPVSVSGISNATAISAIHTNTCALLSDSTIKCWGSNGYGERGDGTTQDYLNQSPTPTFVSGISNATAISNGTLYACALLSDNTIKCWGRNNYGQLGDGSLTQRTTPVTVQF